MIMRLCISHIDFVIKYLTEWTTFQSKLTPKWPEKSFEDAI